MNKNIYIIVAIAAVLLAAGAWLLSGAGSGNPTIENTDSNNSENVENQEDVANENEELTDQDESEDTGDELIDTGEDDNTNNTDNSSDRRMEYTVTYTNNGFSPANLSVFEGSTVTFVNDSSGSMWVASNPHPVHTDFPEFDSKRGVAPGETYEFTFTEGGTYDYHDHLSPSNVGTIIAE